MVAVMGVAMKRTITMQTRRVEIQGHTADQLRLLNNLTRVVLSGSPDLERVMRTVAAVSSEALLADSGMAVLFDASAPASTDEWRRDLIAVAAPKTLVVADQDPNPHGLSREETKLAREAMRTQAPVLLETTNNGQGFPGLERNGCCVRTLACVPFLLSGEVIGVLFVGRHTQQPFTEAEVTLLTALGQQMAIAVRLGRLYDMERERATRSEERERLERDLLSIVSHELRTPLTSIKTSVGALTSLEEVGDGVHTRRLYRVSPIAQHWPQHRPSDCPGKQIARYGTAQSRKGIAKPSADQYGRACA